MKKTKKTALTALLSVALSVSGCGIQESMQTDYGPPPDLNNPEPPETITESQTESVSESEFSSESNFRPETALTQCVYGPPPDLKTSEFAETFTKPSSETVS